VIYGPMNKVGQVGGEASAGRLRELVSKKKGGSPAEEYVDSAV
jgi:hypothetical protein